MTARFVHSYGKCSHGCTSLKWGSFSSTAACLSESTICKFIWKKAQIRRQTKAQICAPICNEFQIGAVLKEIINHVWCSNRAVKNKQKAPQNRHQMKVDDQKVLFVLTQQREVEFRGTWTILDKLCPPLHEGERMWCGRQTIASGRTRGSGHNVNIKAAYQPEKKVNVSSGRRQTHELRSTALQWSWMWPDG